ncbi:MAG TPA: orotate phosphoribosyltransferase [Clostridiales bacterium]|nr:orotate phosphoribosyltransferase [Clostridiales bacterium]
MDAIVCIEGTEVIGAFMAEELIKEGTSIINSNREIHVVTPLNNINRKLMFQGNIQELIYNKNVLLLVPSISTGATISSILECMSYYGGKLAGVSALFHAHPEKLDQEVHALFTYEDIPGYEIYNPRDCVLCKDGLKLDAIIIHDGYTKI